MIPSKDLVGQLVGNYRIESLIAEGGMGRVYRTWQQTGCQP